MMTKLDDPQDAKLDISARSRATTHIKKARALRRDIPLVDLNTIQQAIHTGRK